MNKILRVSINTVDEGLLLYIFICTISRVICNLILKKVYWTCKYIEIISFIMLEKIYRSVVLNEGGGMVMNLI